MTHACNDKATAKAMPISTGVAKPFIAFLLCLLSTAVLCLGAYAFTVEKLIGTSVIPASYKWFLLKEVPGRRIIFESGSNSHHAIDTDVLGKELGMTAINIADNAGYSLEDKITRLETYTRPGDVIVLPLEWSYYNQEKLTDDYVKSIFHDNRDYFHSMPFSKRLKRALTLPPAMVLSQVTPVKNHAEQQTESPAATLFSTALTSPSGHYSRITSSGPGPGVADKSCDDYVLGNPESRKTLALGKNIKPILKRLKRLKSRGIDIHFAWPVLTGEGCMSDPSYVTAFRKDIQDAVNHAGFKFLGASSQSLYAQDLQDDTPYHLTSKGAQLHTAKMVKFLRAEGYQSNGTPLDLNSFARHRLLELELAAVAPLTQPALPFGKTIRMDDIDLRSYVQFSAGWWEFEPFGRWMRDNRAMLRITLPEDLPDDAVLEIKGITKSGKPERVSITVDGALVTSALFGESAPLKIAVSALPRGRTLSVFVNLPDAGPARSPAQNEESEDRRSMSLHIQSFELRSNAAVFAPVKARSAEQALVATKVYSPSENNICSGEPCSPITYGQGWWSQETLGRWMKGKEADLNFVVPDTQEDQDAAKYQIKLEGIFFRGETQMIDVYIDGKLSVTNASDGTVTAPFNALRHKNKVNVSIRLSGTPSASPKQLGLSEDDRTLTYFLKSAALTSI